MHDDGARVSGPAFEPPVAVRRWSHGLRLALVVHAARSVVLWLHGNSSVRIAGSVPSMAALSMVVSVVLALLWLCWVNACRQQLVLLGRRPSFDPLGVLWCLLQLVPLAGWAALARTLRGLVADTDPRQLPPVVEEREQEGGFRQSPVVRVEVGSVARPLFPLWVAATGVSLAILWLGWRDLASPALANARSASHLLGVLLAVHLVGAVSRNLGELERRLRR